MRYPESDPRVGCTATPYSRRTVLARSGQVALGAAAAALPLSSLAACGSASGSPSGSTAVKPGGTLLAGVDSDPDSLDPQKSSLAVSGEIYDGIFSRLVDLRPDGKFAPSLARSWSGADGKSVIFNIRPGVVFHNGDPLTPEDIAFTFERIKNPKFGATYAADFGAVSGVEVTGPHQVTFHLDRPFAPLMANLANRGHILNRRAVESSDPGRQPVGTGPFVLAAWNQGESLTLRRNTKYLTARRPFLNAVKFSYLANNESRILALQSGQLDWVDKIPPQNTAAVKSGSLLRYTTSSVTGRPEFLFFNTTQPPLDNKALRQAICWGINRKEIAEVGFFGAVEPGSEEVGKNSVWYTPGADPYETAPNPVMVRRKLAEAGFPRGGVSVKFAAWTSAPDASRTAQLIQQQLAPYGINIEIETMEISVWTNRLFQRDYQLTVAFQEQIVDPDNFWSLIWTSNAAENVTGYRNPVVDELVARAVAVDDFSSRKALYGKIRATVLEDAPTLFTNYTPMGYASANDIGGIAISPVQDPQFVNIGFT
jgi:peptide/nickel transport system substrate-binding protein